MKKKPRKHWRLSSSQKIMLTASLISLAVTIFLSIFSWRLASSIFEQQEVELLQSTMKRTSDQLINALNTAHNVTTGLAQSKELAELNRLDGSEAESLDSYLVSLSAMMNSVVSNMSGSSLASIQFISIFLKNGVNCSTIPIEGIPYQNYNDCISALLSSGIKDLEGYVSTCWIDNVMLKSGPKRNALIGIRFLYEKVTLDKYGVVVIGLNQTNLQAAFDPSISDSMLIRTDGKIVSTLSSGEIGHYSSNRLLVPYVMSMPGTSPLVNLPDGSSYLIYRMPGETLFLTCPVEPNLLNKTPIANRYISRLILITLIALAVALILIWISSKGLTKSLVHLTNTVEQVEDGNLRARFQTSGHDEIDYLGLKINEMLDQINLSMEIQAQDAAEKQDLELKLLRAQINPHLLYNTLNSALWIIRQKDTEKAEALILSLGNFFKLALSRGNDEITLDNEISMIHQYLEIQNLGRGKSYQLHDEVDEDLKSCLILRLTLQTLVENSVIHGFSDWRDDGEITISAHRLSDEKLMISITDNGIGILPEDLEKLAAQFLRSKAPETHHYGLYNVNRRIQNKYGPAYGLSVESELGVLTRVSITIPPHKEHKDDQSYDN